MSELRQKIQRELACGMGEKGEAREAHKTGSESQVAGRKTESPTMSRNVMEEVCEKENLKSALKRVVSNKGSSGIDGMETEELADYLKEHWPRIKEELLGGRYKPQVVKRVEIPKPGTWEKRKLGIPTVLDRFIQQAVLQVLQRDWDGTFSENSYGFRPGRSAHQAVKKAQEYIREGYEWVVDIDLEKFFDMVNHDRLMSRLAKSIEDKRVLKLIRSYLNAGVMENGVVKRVEEGTPQGGPLSPFLSNVVLDELDKELESRGHKFVRYADDSNIYVRSERAGKRVMDSMKRFIWKKLKLRVNENKSEVGQVSKRKFLGFSFMVYGKERTVKIRIASQSIKRFKERVRQLTNRNRSTRNQKRIRELSKYLKEWMGYYRICETPTPLRDLDSWIRHRLRSAMWRQWKTCKNRYKQLEKLGVYTKEAAQIVVSSKGSWRLSRSKAVSIALSSSYFDSLGLPRLKSLMVV